MIIVNNKGENDELLDALGHEIKNPIALINANIDYINESKEVKETRINIIKGQLEKIMLITEQIMNIKKYKEEPKKNTWILDMIEELVHTYSSSYKGINIEIEEEVLEVECNVNLIELAISNMLKNGVEALDEVEHKEIKIKLEEDNEYIKIIVENSGKGLEGVTKEELMKNKITTKEKGTGLGLSIIEYVAKEHGGKFTLENRDEGGCVAMLAIKK